MDVYLEYKTTKLTLAVRITGCYLRVVSQAVNRATVVHVSLSPPPPFPFPVR